MRYTTLLKICFNFLEMVHTALEKDIRTLNNKLDFLEATEACLGLGDGWNLPVEYNEEINQYLLDNSINSSWTGLVRVVFPKWKWINGSEGIFPQT